MLERERNYKIQWKVAQASQTSECQNFPYKERVNIDIRYGE